jgi:twinkle protein
MGAPMIAGDFSALPKRRISEETCRHLDYRVNEERGEQIATYYDAEGQPCAQKIRGRGKSFRWTGEPSKATLYGQTKWGQGSRRVIVTEGEVDALSVDEALGRKWPVVSVPNGAGGAKDALAKQIEWLDTFDEVVLFFDQDEPGQKAAIECAELFAPGKCKIVSGFAFKDANEALVAGKVDLIVKAQYNARAYWPDDIVAGNSEDGWEELIAAPTEPDYDYPWSGLQTMTRGIRKGEVVMLTGGTGGGKSQALREITYALLPKLKAQNERVGLICLEENERTTRLGLMSLHLNRPLHLTREGVTNEMMRQAYDEVLSSALIFRHWGGLESTRLFSKIRAMAAANCSVIVLDHISIVVSGTNEAETDGGERRVIDKLMTRLRSLVEELGIACFVISHLKKPNGTPFEEGAQVSMADLRGSSTLMQIPDIIIAYERNQQHEDPRLRTISTVRLLKNRFASVTGVAGLIEYSLTTGRYTEVADDPFAEETACPTDAASAGF